MSYWISLLVLICDEDYFLFICHFYLVTEIYVTLLVNAGILFHALHAP